MIKTPYELLTDKELEDEAKYRPTGDLCAVLIDRFYARDREADDDRDDEIEDLECRVSELEDEVSAIEDQRDELIDLAQTFKKAITDFDTEASERDNTRVFIETLRKDLAEFEKKRPKLLD